METQVQALVSRPRYPEPWANARQVGSGPRGWEATVGGKPLLNARGRARRFGSRKAALAAAKEA